MTRLLAAPPFATGWATARVSWWPQLAATGFGFVLIVSLSAADGGYWPTAWTWGGLALAWAAIVTLLVRERVGLVGTELAIVLLFAAFLAWTLVSLLWTSSIGRTALEAQRTILYVLGLLAVFLLVRGRRYEALLGGVWAAITAIACYALATRLFPSRLGIFDPIAGYRLSEPLGYWNALGILAVIGTLLGVGFALRAPGPLLRAAAAASLVVLIATVYFTFSRGAWIALAFGLAGSIALDPRRLQLVTGTLALAVAPAVGLLVAYESDALTHSSAALATASREGQRLALVLVGLAAVNAVFALGFAFAERRVAVPGAVRIAYAAALAAGVVAALAIVFVRYGSPPTLVARAYDTLSQPSSEPRDLNQRFFTLSSRARVASWRTAWADVEDHPVLGSGAGSYELYWAQNRPYATKVRDAHTIYLETLAELGPIGLGLLVAGFAVPAVAALRNRRAAFVPAAFAAYLAYLVHAGVDWDWEMTAVTMAALVSGAALLIAGRSEGDREFSRRVRFALVAVLLVVAAGTFVAAVGNQALASGKRAALAGHWADAESHARTAMRWMPWSSDPWQLAGHAYLARGERERAEGALRTAIEKDPKDWELWLDLALATRGRERREVAAEAVRLNPLGPELASLRRLLGVETGQE